MGNGILPIPARQAVKADGLRSAIGHERHVVHDRRAVGLLGQVHVEFLHVIPFHIKQERHARWIGGLRQDRVLNAHQELTNALPALIAFVGILRIERRQDVSDLHHAAQNVHPVVCRREQLDEFHHRRRPAGVQLQQVGFVAVAKLVPSQVGAPVPNGQVPQNPRRARGISVASIHFAVLTTQVNDALGTVLSRSNARGEKRSRLKGLLQAERVQLAGAANHEAAPLAPNIQSGAAIHGVPQKAELDGTSRGAIRVQEPTTRHHQRTGIRGVFHIANRAHTVVGAVIRFHAAFAFHAQHNGPRLNGQRVLRIDKHLLRQDVQMVAAPGGASDARPLVVRHPHGIPCGNFRAPAKGSVGEDACLG